MIKHTDPAAAAESFQRAERARTNAQSTAVAIRSMAQALAAQAAEMADLAAQADQAPDDLAAVGALLDAPAVLESMRALVGAILALNQERRR